MKLAEALLNRKSLLEKINNFSATIEPSLHHEDGEVQDADYNVLITEFQDAVAEYIDLVIRINLTNNATLIEFNGVKMFIMRAIALKESFTLTKNLFTNLGYRRQPKKAVYGQTTVDIIHDVPQSHIKNELNRGEKSIRELDVIIQTANWSTELL
jgi:hypothetical protein